MWSARGVMEVLLIRCGAGPVAACGPGGPSRRPPGRRRRPGGLRGDAPAQAPGYRTRPAFTKCLLIILAATRAPARLRTATSAVAPANTGQLT